MMGWSCCHCGLFKMRSLWSTTDVMLNWSYHLYKQNHCGYGYPSKKRGIESAAHFGWLLFHLGSWLFLLNVSLLNCTHPVVIKWWISLEFKPVALYAINKYSFSYYPSSGISSSIMAEITAVKAVYALPFSSTWFGRYLWNYWSVEAAAEVGGGEEQSIPFVLFLCFEIPSPRPIPRVPLFCFSFQSTHKSLHWSQLSCENKNDPKLFKNYSGTAQCSISHGEAKADT